MPLTAASALLTMTVRAKTFTRKVISWDPQVNRYCILECQKIGHKIILYFPLLRIHRAYRTPSLYFVHIGPLTSREDSICGHWKGEGKWKISEEEGEEAGEGVPPPPPAARIEEGTREMGVWGGIRRRRPRSLMDGGGTKESEGARQQKEGEKKYI